MYRAKNSLIILIWLVFVFNLYSDHPTSAQEEADFKRYFEMSLEELMNVEITTAGKTLEKIREIPASVVIVTRADIEKYGYRTLVEVLENVPGLYSINDWTLTGHNFGVRGFWSIEPNRNMIFMVNGVRQDDAMTHGSFMASINLPVEAIDRIEVVRGPMSVIYGCGAFYGAINVITDEVPDDGAVSVVAGGLGTDGTSKLVARSSGQEGQLKYTFNTSLYDTRGVDEPYSKMGGTGDYTSGGHVAQQDRYFGFSGSFNGLYADLSFNQSSMTHPMRFQPHEDYDAEHVISMTRIFFGYRRALSNAITLDGNILYNSLNVFFNFDTGVVPDAYEIEMLLSNTLDVDVNAFITSSDWFELTLGLNYRSFNDLQFMLDLPAFGISNYNDRILNPIVTRSFYSQMKIKLINDLIIVGGIRLEQMLKYDFIIEKMGGMQYVDTDNYYGYQGGEKKYTYDEDKIEAIPRIAAIFTPGRNHVLKFLFGEALNRPSFHTFTIGEIDSTATYLRPEKIKTVEVNYTAALSSRFSVGMSVFHNNMENLINRKNYDYNGISYTRWSNEGKITSNGLELQIQARPYQSLEFDLSATYQDLVDENHEDIAVAFSPKLLGYMKAAYRIGRNATFAMTGNFVDGMEAQYSWDLSDPSDSQSPPKGRLGEKVKSYFNLGANVRIDNLLFNGMYCNLKISNILDTDIFYPTNANNQLWATRGTLGIGRTFLFTVGWQK